MKRLLILCRREEFGGSDAGLRPERYLYEIFRRIAAEGHYVAWLAHRPSSFAFSKGHRALAEKRGSIQYARFGPLFLFPWVVRMILRRMTRNQAPAFDVLVDCVEGRPLRLACGKNTRVLPVVFQFHRKRYAPLLARPLIAATPQAAQHLEEAGIPSGHIIRAYGGATDEEWARAAGLVFAAIENLDQEPIRPKTNRREKVPVG